MSKLRSRPLFEGAIVRAAVVESFRKLDPRVQLRNPVMFVVLVTAVLTTVLGFQAVFGRGEEPAGFVGAVSVWLWFTVLFANFAEALAEGRSKAQAASLRSLKKETWAKKLKGPQATAEWFTVPATDLRKGDLVLVHAN